MTIPTIIEIAPPNPGKLTMTIHAAIGEKSRIVDIEAEPQLIDLSFEDFAELFLRPAYRHIQSFLRIVV